MLLVSEGAWSCRATLQGHVQPPDLLGGGGLHHHCRGPTPRSLMSPLSSPTMSSPKTTPGFENGQQGRLQVRRRGHGSAPRLLTVVMVMMAAPFMSMDEPQRASRGLGAREAAELHGPRARAMR